MAARAWSPRVSNTLDHMHTVGVRDPHLERILRMAQDLEKLKP